MNKKMLITLIVTVFMVVIAMIGTVYAWLTSKGNTSDTDIKVTMGEVSYTITGSLANPTIVPGENLITTGNEIIVTNSSTVDSDIRIKIDVYEDDSDDASVTATALNGGYEWTIGTASTDNIIITLGSNFGAISNGYYYYDNIATSVTDIDIITQMQFNGEKTGNEVEGKSFIIVVTFEAKQNDYLTWADAASANIDFTTGKPSS